MKKAIVNFILEFEFNNLDDETTRMEIFSKSEEYIEKLGLYENLKTIEVELTNE